MTFVGKILVIAIMAFSLAFPGDFDGGLHHRRKTGWLRPRPSRRRLRNSRRKCRTPRRSRKRPRRASRMRRPRSPPRPSASKNRLAHARRRTQTRSRPDHGGPWHSSRPHEQTAKSSLHEVEAKRQQTDLLRTQLSAAEKQAQRVQAAPGRAQRQDSRSGTDSRYGHQEQLRPARAGRQVLHAVASERIVRRHQPDQGTGEPAPGRGRSDADRSDQPAAWR